MSRFLPIPEGLAGERVDVAVSRMVGISRSKAADMVDAGLVMIDGRQAVRSMRVNGGELLELSLDELEPAAAPEPAVELPIVWQDEHIVVVDKPVGVAAHPSPGWTGPTVTGSLAAQGVLLADTGAPERQGVVHRLDVGTSGLMVLAKSSLAYSTLKAAFKERTVSKVYRTVVQGHLDPFEGTIDAPIDRHPTADHRWAVVTGGRPSITHYRTLEAFPHASLVEVHLETGRTHQIRVHMSALRHPCVGDLTYGADPRLAERLGITRQWLHAAELSFDHPATGQRVTFTSEPPADLAQALERLRQWAE